jgi:hypothetical protein
VRRTAANRLIFSISFDSEPLTLEHLLSFLPYLPILFARYIRSVGNVGVSSQAATRNLLKMGCFMNRSKALLCLPILFLSVIFASSCSGPKNGVCTINCGGGNALVVVTVTSTPSQTFFFPYLVWDITSVQLVNASGSTTILQSPLAPTDFARLQTDSQFLDLAKLQPVPAGVYSSVVIQLQPSTTSSYFYNSSGATLLNCAAGAVCLIPNTVPGFTATKVTVPASFTVTANQNTGFSLNIDLSKIVTSAGGMTFDFTKAGAITLSTLPRTGLSSGVDSFENFTGVVSATTATSFDMFSLSSDTRTFTMAANPEFDDPFSVCPTQPATFTCIVTNQNISVDAVINSDGTFTAYEVEFLDKSAQETEGIIVPPISNTQFKMVVTNGVGNSTFLPGALATVTVNGASTYFADPKNLGPTVSITPQGFRSSADLVVGQTVMLQGGSADFTTNTLSGYTRTLLRYSSIGGTIQSPSGTIFTLSGVSPFFTNLSTNSVSVQTFPNTTYENITGFTGLSGNLNASVRGLYLNPNSGVTQPLLAAEVRTH